MDESRNSSSYWSRDQDIAFENALANHPEEWEQFAAYVTGKSLEEIKRHYVDLIDDVNHIESGYVPLPDYNEIGPVKKVTETSRTVQERRKGIPWTEAEHRLFLQGLENHGWGDWRSISRNCVVTRTPTQVASHAQKYKIRQNSKEKKKERKRSSIHDVTHVKNDDISAPQGPITGQASGSAASSSGQSAEEASPSPPTGIYAAPRIEQPIGGSVVSAVGTPVNLTAAGQSADQAPPTPPAGIYAAPRIEHPIGGHLVSAIGTPVNLTAAGQSAGQAPPTPPGGIYAAPRIEHPIGRPLASAVGTPVNLSAAIQSAEQAPPTPPAAIYAAPRIEHPIIGGHLVSAVGTPVNLSSAGQSAEQAPPALPAGIYAAPRIEHSTGGSLVSAVGTPVNLTALGHMAYEIGPDSGTVMPGEPNNLGPMTYPMQYTYAHS